MIQIVRIVVELSSALPVMARVRLMFEINIKPCQIHSIVPTKSIEINTPITLSYGTGLTGVVSTLLGNESWLIRALESVSKN